MFELDAAAFYKAVTSLNDMATRIKAKGAGEPTTNPDGSVTITPISDQVFIKIVLNECQHLADSLTVLGAGVSLDALNDLRMQLAGRYKPTLHDLASSLTEVSRTCQSAHNRDPGSACKRDPLLADARRRCAKPSRSAAHRRRARWVTGVQARFLNRQLSLPVSMISQ